MFSFSKTFFGVAALFVAVLFSSLHTGTAAPISLVKSNGGVNIPSSSSSSSYSTGQAFDASEYDASDLDMADEEASDYDNSDMDMSKNVYASEKDASDYNGSEYDALNYDAAAFEEDAAEEDAARTDESSAPVVPAAPPASRLILKDCEICYEEIKSHSDLSDKFGCATIVHQFHAHCADKWIRSKNEINETPSCPYCRYVALEFL